MGRRDYRRELWMMLMLDNFQSEGTTQEPGKHEILH